ncbi:alpha/beta hydrolase [Patescibacteria group bacterium]|nr:alpha/beta hydrolase [Patescibacteria group bacterium]
MHIVIDNILINLEILKNANASKYLVILHGWQRSLKEWKPIARKMPKYNILLVDLPGFGFSSPPPKPFDNYDYARIIIKLLRKLKIRKYVLLGHSSGGRVAAIISVLKPRDAAKLILVSSAGLIDTRFKNSALKKIGGLSPILNILPSAIAEKIKNAFGSSDYRASKNLKKTFIKVVNQDLTSVFSKISAQTLIIWGEQDKVLPVNQAKILKNLVQKSKLRIVWGTGHNPHLENSEEFIKILEEENIL